MKESELQAAIIEMAHYSGWLVYHTHDSRRSNPGFPDLVMVHPKHKITVFAELKSATGRLSPEQQLWADALHTVCNLQTLRYFLWRPEDLDDALAYLQKPA